MPTVIKMFRYRGDTLRLPITIKDSAGQAINLIGSSIRFTLATAIPITHETQYVSVVREDSDGLFTIIVPYSVMGEVPAGRYLMDVEITYPDQTRNTLFILELTLTGDKTV